MKILKNLPSIFTKKQDTTLGHLMGSIDSSLAQANTDLDLLNLQYSLNTATGVWLNEYGDRFGVPRLKAETDENYRKAILHAILKPKITIGAIEKTIRPLLDDPTRPLFIAEMFNQIARYNMSNHSGVHKYQDATKYRHSVISIQTGYLDERIRKELRSVTAAGIKYYFDLLADTGGHPNHSGGYGEVSFLEWKLFENYGIHYNIKVSDTINSNVFSGRFSTESKHSGRQVLFNYNNVDKLLGSSMLNRLTRDLSNDYVDTDHPNNSLNRVLHEIGYNEDDYEVRRNKRGIPYRSEFSSERGNRLERCGTRTGDVDRKISIHQVKPVNRLFPVSSASLIGITGEVETKVHGMEIYIERASNSINGGALGDEVPIRGRISGGNLGECNNIISTITG